MWHGGVPVAQLADNDLLWRCDECARKGGRVGYDVRSTLVSTRAVKRAMCHGCNVERRVMRTARKGEV